MTLLAGAFSCDDAWDPHDTALSLAGYVARHDGLAARLLRRDSRQCLFVVERSDDDPQSVSWRDRSGNDYTIIGDVNYAAPPLRERVIAANQACDPLELNIPGRWVGLRMSPDSEKLQLVTDRFASNWVYIAALPTGFVFSSDFGALAQLLQGSLSVDIDSVLFELCLGFLPAERTIYRQISIAPPRAIVEFTRSGMKELTRVRPTYGDRYVGASQIEKFRRLDEIFESIFAQSVKEGYADRLVLSLSAGLDSRFCLAFFNKFGINSDHCTFGDPDSREVEGARKTAEIVAAETHVFNFANSEWIQWQRATQQLGMSGTVQWSGWSESWFEFLRGYGQAVTIGYLGDHLTGKKLAYKADAGQDWLQYWISQKLVTGIAQPNLMIELVRPEARVSMERLLRDNLTSMIGAADYALPHQPALHLNLYGRQRRRVAAQANLISRHLTPVVPLYDDALIDFFMNVDQSDLRNQRLYKAYGQDRFPRLFEKEPSKQPSVALRSIRKAFRMGKSLAGRSIHPAPPTVIDRDRMIIPNKKNIIELARKVAPLIEAEFDLDAFCDGVAGYGTSPSLTSGLILAMTNACHLLDLYDQQ